MLTLNSDGGISSMKNVGQMKIKPTQSIVSESQYTQICSN